MNLSTLDEMMALGIYCGTPTQSAKSRAKLRNRRPSEAVGACSRLTSMGTAKI
jgi:hypothetical protein